MIEELSQLSKEYFFAHLDHDAVPETVASWARYGAASPDKALEPLEELVRRAGLHITEVPVTMNLRVAGQSRIFNSWLSVGRYMAATTLLCLARWRR